MPGALLLLFMMLHPKFELKNGPVTFTIPVAKTRQTLRAAAHDPKRAVVLRVEGISVTGSPGTSYEVYAGLPKGTTPDPHGPYFAGLLSTYGAEEQNGAYVVTIPLRGAVTRALDTKGDVVAITFIPAGSLTPGSAIRFKRLRFVTE